MAAMELIVLGTSGGFPAAGRATSGYLLRHDGFNLVVDFGTGVLANLQRYVALDDLHAVAISHGHADHCCDLYPLYIARAYAPEPAAHPPLEVFAPPNALSRLAGLDNDPGQPFGGTFSIREVEPGATVEAGPFRIETRLLPHLLPNMGMRIGDGSSVVAYTGDTGPSEEVETLARDADVLLAEANWLDGQQDGKPPIHLTAGQAGTHAARAGVGTLALTHLWPSNPRERSLEESASAFGGHVVLADELEPIPL